MSHNNIQDSANNLSVNGWLIGWCLTTFSAQMCYIVPRGHEIYCV